jgi:spore coat polysaccharide biosynthesis protein SpsF
MGSSRLPGKVLTELAGRPALDYLLERLARAEQLEEVVVATSITAADDAIVEHCLGLDVSVHRGSEEDVVARLLEAAQHFGLDGFVRINGDSPLLDQTLIDRGVGLFRESARDLVTNVFPRSFPPGQSVEVLRTDALHAALALMTEPDDREHVTTAVYRHSAQFAVENFTAGDDGVGPDGGTVRLVLDTTEDAALIERMLQAIERPHWQYGWTELLALARQLAALR